MSGGPKAFVDLASLPEDERIEHIVSTANCGHVVGVFVDDYDAADRYIRKFRDRVKILDRQAGAMPTAPKVVFLRVGPKGH